VPVTAYLWGGGGGGGGRDSAILVALAAVQDTTQVNFVVNEGDIIEVAVGGKGTGGQIVPAMEQADQLGPVM
jgi:hypothetical protein